MFKVDQLSLREFVSNVAQVVLQANLRTMIVLRNHLELALLSATFIKVVLLKVLEKFDLLLHNFYLGVEHELLTLDLQ